jgi:hypothetical protein
MPITDHGSARLPEHIRDIGRNQRDHNYADAQGKGFSIAGRKHATDYIDACRARSQPDETDNVKEDRGPRFTSPPRDDQAACALTANI